MSSSPDSAVTPLLIDLERIFGSRLRCVAVYGGNGAAEYLAHGASGGDDHVHTACIIESLTADDLKQCARQAEGWHKKHLATPLLMTHAELGASLDAYPLELAEIIAHHRVVHGTDVFAGLAVDAADIRRACEVQARGHLLHLREGFVEAAGDERTLVRLIQQSVRPFKLLLANLERLGGHDFICADANLVRKVLAAGGRDGISRSDAQDLFPAYLEAVERLVRHIDSWKA